VDSTKDFVADFWANLDGWLVFFNVSSGILLGTVGGLVLVIWLQKGGFLGRNNRWHHLLLKLYFLALPCPAWVVSSDFRPACSMLQKSRSTAK